MGGSLNSLPLANLELLSIHSRTTVLLPGRDDSAARQFATFAQSGLAQGLSANAIITAARNGGLSIRRQDALAAIRQLRAGEAATAELATLPRSGLPSGAGLSPAQPNQRRDYNYVFRYDVVDPSSGDIVDEGLFGTLATNTLLTPDAASAAFMRLRGVPRRSR